MKKIIITGSSGKLGEYLTGKFLKDNYYVINISRTIKKKQFAKEFFKCDLSKDDEVRNIFKTIKRKHRKISLILSCAGESKKNYGTIINSSSFLNAFKNNFLTFSNILEIYSDIFRNLPTKFIAISSIAGIKNIGAPVTYSVAKSSLNYYCQLKAKELAKHNIQINIISPGNILMKNNLWSVKLKKNELKTLRYIKKNVPLNCFSKPSQIFKICKYLESKDGDNITGSNFTIDGGQHL